jgi:hypothetical protein
LQREIESRVKWIGEEIAKVSIICDHNEAVLISFSACSNFSRLNIRSLVETKAVEFKLLGSPIRGKLTLGSTLQGKKSARLVNPELFFFKKILSNSQVKRILKDCKSNARSWEPPPEKPEAYVASFYNQMQD